MLTACGIETCEPKSPHDANLLVATVLTACGIETNHGYPRQFYIRINMLQQCLPLAVLKLRDAMDDVMDSIMLQQCLPLAVLKLCIIKCGYTLRCIRCNSAYRLRY